MAPKRSNKRRRELEDELGPAESEPPASSTATRAWKPHPEFWLEHGDIVLVCEKTGFRVGKCVLAANSPVFRKMFKSAAAHGEMFEGFPVLHLEDPAGDMYQLLRAIHFRLYVRLECRQNFTALTKVLRLSTKYAFADLRTDIIDILTTIFPSTLSLYATTFKHLRAQWPDIDTVLAVELAKQCDIPLILPAACYMSALQPAKIIMNTDIGSASASTRSCCVIIRDELMNTVEELLMDVDITRIREDRSHDNGCLTGGCRNLWSVQSLHLEARFPRLSGDIFDTSLSDLEDAAYICKSMQTEFTRHWSGIQQDIWDSLPSLCGFQDWEDVKAAHEASLNTSNEKKL